MPILFRKGLAAGTYIVFYQPEYDGLHPEKKLVLQTYTHDACEIELLDQE
jgi:hypothetical protein